MKRLFLSVLLPVCIIMAGSCEKENTACNPSSSLSVTANSSKEEDNAVLKQLAEELYNISGSLNCNQTDNWKIAPLGAKPCGGPHGYIAYRSDVDEVCFLKKLAYYKDQVLFYNQKYQLISDCSVPPQPKGVVCENNKPVFTY